jgi:hypothetical protein
MPTNLINKSDAARIQSTQDKTGKNTGKGSFAAVKNENLTRSQAQLDQVAGLSYQDQQREELRKQ